MLRRPSHPGLENGGRFDVPTQADEREPPVGSRSEYDVALSFEGGETLGEILDGERRGVASGDEHVAPPFHARAHDGARQTVTERPLALRHEVPGRAEGREEIGTRVELRVREHRVPLDAAKDLVRLAEVASRAKRSHNHPNLLRRDSNSDNSLTVVCGHSHYTQAGIFVRLESLPERDDCPANDVSFEGFNRRHGGVLLRPPLTRLARNNRSVLLGQLVVVNIAGSRCFRFPDRKAAIAVSIFGVGVKSRFNRQDKVAVPAMTTHARHSSIELWRNRSDYF